MTHAGSRSPWAILPFGASPLLAERFDRHRVTGLRHALASCVERAGLAGQRLDDFVLAVNELITNAVRHGGGVGELTLWRTSDMVLCEVSDGGGGIGRERVANHNRPLPDTAGGWGLWLAEQLSDTMQVRTGPSGTTVRVGAMLRPRGAVPESVE
jgi:serine/threonine-protein kinase RsbW